MNEQEFSRALNACDKVFNMSAVEVADKVLTTDEITALCGKAQKVVREIFPNRAQYFTVTPSEHNSAEDEFAGYRLKYENGDDVKEEIVEFDFGSQGVDVVDGPNNVA